MMATRVRGQSGGDAPHALVAALALTGSYAVVEVVGAIVAGSLALLADVGHMLTDAVALGLALMAVSIATRAPTARHTFGFQRAEVLIALLNGLALWALAGWIFLEAYRRFQSPPDVQAPWLLVLGALGLAVNVAAVFVLHPSAERSVNIQGALLHVAGDLLGSLGVLVGGILILWRGWVVADPIIGAVVAVLIVASSAGLLRRVLRMVMEGTPSRLDLAAFCRRLEGVNGVTGVHDLHVWTLTGGYDVMSAHVTTSATDPVQRQGLLRRLKDVAVNDFGVRHVTIQLEDVAAECEQETHHIVHD